MDYSIKRFYYIAFSKPDTYLTVRYKGKVQVNYKSLLIDQWYKTNASFHDLFKYLSNKINVTWKISMFCLFKLAENFSQFCAHTYYPNYTDTKAQFCQLFRHIKLFCNKIGKKINKINFTTLRMKVFCLYIFCLFCNFPFN